MRPEVILHWCILISFALVVRCSTQFDEEFLTNLKCLVCKATIREMENEIKKVDPRKKVNVGGFRLDASGKSKTKNIPYAKSETFLTELMESICDDKSFSKARVSIISDIVTSQMVRNDGALDFTPDGDLSKTLNHFCLEILENDEDIILKQFMAEVTPENVGEILCTEMTQYCDGFEEESRRSEL